VAVTALSRCVLIQIAASSVVISSLARAQDIHPSSESKDTTTTISFSGYVDTYYAYDFNKPVNHDRAFTTQPARHNEFNVNLAFLGAKVSGPRIRGRLAVQAGTSVQSNYSGEPTLGAVSGPSLTRFLQEAVAGIRLGESVWLDAGIFFSHVGMESFISRDNLTYTRSLSADYTPYYESGARLMWNPNQRITTTLVLVNGWQNISENNRDKALGLRVDLSQNSSTTISYYNFIGKENQLRQLRFFNGVGAKIALTPGLTMQANADYGSQQNDADDSPAHWYSVALIVKAERTPRLGMSARIERYADPHQIIVPTGSEEGFEATTASFGVDITPRGTSRAVWRSELRGTWADDSIFPDHSASGFSRRNVAAVTSLTLTF